MTEKKNTKRQRRSIAVVGAGLIGHRHVEFVSDSDDIDLTAVVDPDSTVSDLADKHQAAYFHNINDMLSVMRPDGIIVATPTTHHLSPVIASIEAGIPVMVEKPITATLDEAREICQKSIASGVKVLVGHHRRYNPIITMAADIVQGGEIGNLLGVAGQWTVRKPDQYFDSPWRQTREAGPIITNLIHDIDMLRSICGELVSLSADSANRARNFDKEDVVALIMQFESGALGTFLLSDAAPSPWTWEQGTGESPNFPYSGQNSIRFMGSKGALEFPRLRVWQHEDDAGDWRQTLKPRDIEVTEDDAFKTQLRHFCAVIEGQEEPLISAADATRTLQATLAVFDAAQSGNRYVFEELL